MQLYLLSASESTGEDVTESLSDMSVFKKVTGFIGRLKLLNYWFTAVLQYVIINVPTLPFLKSFPKFVLHTFLIPLIFLSICSQDNCSQTQVGNALALQVCCLTKNWHYSQTQQEENPKQSTLINLYYNWIKLLFQNFLQKMCFLPN